VKTVTIRELRHHGGQVVDRAAAGERITVTRDGRPLAELRPIRQEGTPVEALLERWRTIPSVDPVAHRRDIDSVIDQEL
jgi:prevent-host-death family protein